MSPRLPPAAFAGAPVARLDVAEEHPDDMIHELGPCLCYGGAGEHAGECRCMRSGVRRGDQNGPRAVVVPCEPEATLPNTENTMKNDATENDPVTRAYASNEKRMREAWLPATVRTDARTRTRYNDGSHSAVERMAGGADLSAAELTHAEEMLGKFRFQLEQDATRADAPDLIERAYSRNEAAMLALGSTGPTVSRADAIRAAVTEAPDPIGEAKRRQAFDAANASRTR